MKLCLLLAVFVGAVIVGECYHTFMGDNVHKQLVYQRDVNYARRMLRERTETIKYTIPPSYGYGRSIQGLLVYDLKNGGATANVTAGGVGFPYVTLRLKSERGKAMKFDVYLYA